MNGRKRTVIQTRFISAICTPLDENEALHREALERHLDEQWRAGIAGVLVGGTMGLMQLLSDATYRQLAECGAKFTAGRGEVLVGVGDTSFTRTRDRIRMVEGLAIDGVVVVTPYLWKFSQDDLVGYFRALADAARKPVYLYDLPGLTGVKLELETVLQAARHPNIRGIKCSSEWVWTRQLLDRVGDRFRVIPAQPHLIDMLIRCGVRDNLDGIYALAPRWAVGIAEAAEMGDWPLAARRQQRLSALLTLLTTRYPLFPSCGAVLNARGIAGRVAPAPMRPLNPEQRARLLDEPMVKELLADHQMV
jgi:4-hydroxy-tetrahydrodipicolinate synthase